MKGFIEVTSNTAYSGKTLINVRTISAVWTERKGTMISVGEYDLQAQRDAPWYVAESYDEIKQMIYLAINDIEVDK